MTYRINTYIALITYTGIMILPINAPMMTLNAAIPSVAVVSIPLGIRISRILCIPNGSPERNDIVNIGLHFILKNVRPYAAPCSEA